MLTENKLRQIIDCAYDDITSDPTLSEAQKTIISMTMCQIVGTLVETGAPLFNPIFIDCLRRVANVCDLMIQEDRK